MRKIKRKQKATDRPRLPNHVLISNIAERLENMGYKPFRSEAERYMITAPADGSRPELVELGRAPRGGRFFRNNSLRRDTELVSQFGEFAKVNGLRDCYFWNISLTGCKAQLSSLANEVDRFNADINQHFSELRKTRGFEVLTLALHFRYDKFKRAIDLHAHFVCRVPASQLLETQTYLLTKFSLAYVKPKPIQNAEAVLNYMLSGIFDNHEMIDWPDDALEAVWQMAQTKRYRYVRTGASFAEWRKGKRSANDNAPSKKPLRKPAIIRVPGATRFLARVTAKINGKRVAALLYERRVDHRNGVVRDPEYSTAISRTTQGTPEQVQPSSEGHPPNKIPFWGVKAVFCALSSAIVTKITRCRNWLLHRFRV